MGRNWFLVVLLAMVGGACAGGVEMSVEVTQITFGPKNHFFGYIGHALTIPWNASGRYIVALQTDFTDRMPLPGESVNVVLIDTQDEHRVTVLDRTFAWNLQQGSMLYWNPAAAETQFFFNDLDPATGLVFTVLYDVAERRRVREYRFANESVANGGVAPNGRYFAGINYGKITRSREIISYAGARDWTADGPANPETDGLFRVDIATGERKLLVSCRTLQDLLLDTPTNRRRCGAPDQYPVYVHHTLWNRDSDMIAFIVRGKGNKLPDAGCAIRSDGSGLTQVPFAGHPEWAEGKVLVQPHKENAYFRLHDVVAGKEVGRIGGPGIFLDTKEDNALSPDAKWYVGSHKPVLTECIYTLYRLADGACFRSPTIPSRGGGVCRVDPAPRWNRSSDSLLVPGIAPDGTLQLFILQLKPQPVQPVDTPTYANVPYGPHERNVLDFWRAEGTGPRPLLVNIHGGGWTHGDKSPEGNPQRAWLAKGVSYATINYRLAPAAPLPAPVHDAARALQFLRTQAGPWNIATNRIALTGGSAGGCTAMWLLCHDDLADPAAADPVLRESTRVAGAAVMRAQASIDPMQIEPWLGTNVLQHGMIYLSVGELTAADAIRNYDRHRPRYVEFSPINHVSKDDPPLFMQCDADLSVPARHASHGIHHPLFGVKMKEQADRVGMECHLQVGKGREIKSSQYASAAEFLEAVLLGR
jgi:acetyl esterase/lipase